MLNIIVSTISLTFEDFRLNKMRTALSLTGVAFGIFCIIGVLATVNSLERNIQNQVQALGSNTIYIDKWDYTGGHDYPMWKFRSRPRPKFEEAAQVRERSELTDKVTYLMQMRGSISHKDDVLDGVSVYGINEEQIDIQPIKFETGRYFSASEFNSGSNMCILGNTNAENFLVRLRGQLASR